MLSLPSRVWLQVTSVHFLTDSELFRDAREQRMSALFCSPQEQLFRRCFRLWLPGANVGARKPPPPPSPYFPDPDCTSEDQARDGRRHHGDPVLAWALVGASYSKPNDYESPHGDIVMCVVSSDSYPPRPTDPACYSLCSPLLSRVSPFTKSASRSDKCGKQIANVSLVCCNNSMNNARTHNRISLLISLWYNWVSGYVPSPLFG